MRYVSRLVVLRRFYSNSNNKTIGFIGLGQMGLHMSKNLVNNSEHTVKVYDTDGGRYSKVLDLINSHSKDRLVRIEALSDLKDCSVVITMLPNSSIVEEVCLNSKSSSLINILKPNTLHIDCSTIAPDRALFLHNQFKSKDIISVDAPVSGGVIGAEESTLSFMIGTSDPKIYERTKEIVEKMGKKTFNCKKSGLGQTAKICNNMMLAISMTGLSECLVLANQGGLDPILANQIMNQSTGQSWASSKNSPVPKCLPTNIPANNNYAGGFNIKLINKDLNLATELAKNVKVDIKLGAIAKNIYENLANNEEYNKLDFGAYYKWLQQKYNTNH